MSDLGFESFSDVLAIHVSKLHLSPNDLSGIVERYTGIDISKFPPIRALNTFRGILVHSSAVLSLGAVAEMGLDPLVGQCGDIKEGLTAIASVTLSLSSPIIFQIRRDTKLEARICKHNFSSFSPIAFMRQLFPSILPSLSSLLQFDQLGTIGIPSLKPFSVRYDGSQNLVLTSKSTKCCNSHHVCHKSQ